jgi:hypothetical protein
MYFCFFFFKKKNYIYSILFLEKKNLNDYSNLYIIYLYDLKAMKGEKKIKTLEI